MSSQPPFNYSIPVDVSTDFAYETTSLVYSTDAGGNEGGDGAVTEIELDGSSSPVTPANTTSNYAQVTGNYLDVGAASDGDIKIYFPSDQDAINAINANTSGQQLTDTLDYTVDGISGENSVALALTDINLPDYQGEMTVTSGQTVDLTDLQISIPASTGQAAPDPVIDYNLSANTGTLVASGLSETTETSTGSNSIDLHGTVSEINYDLSHGTFTYTANGDPGTQDNINDSATETGPDAQTTPNYEVVTIDVNCFRAGTRILTVRGEVAIEELSTHDTVVIGRSEASATGRVVWTGHRRIDCAKHPNPQAVWPVRVKSGAFAASLPTRDLWLSPGHSVLLEGVLVQIDNLINGVTILQVPCATVDYWHVELDAHDVLISEGLATESYLDTGNRAAFVGGGTYLELHPDFAPKHWSETCVPLVMEGPVLSRAKARTLERAQKLGYQVSAAGHAHLRVDGVRIEPVLLDAKRLTFMLPEGAQDIELQSRYFVPAQMLAASSDRRQLGLCVSRMQVDGNEVAMDDDAILGTGWHQVEHNEAGRQWRWTQGGVSIAAGTRLVVIDLDSRGYYWDEPARRAIADCA